MTFLDKIKSVIPFKKKPKIDQEAVVNQVVDAVMSNYRGRKQMFGGEKYDGGLNYSTAVGLNRAELVERSEKAYEESMQARAAINRLNESVINTGLSLEATPENSILNINPEIRNNAIKSIETRFRLWSNSKKCDLSENNTLGQMERIEFNNQLVKGDYFAFLNFSDDQQLINPLQVKIITPNRVSTPVGTNFIKEAENRGNRIVEGIEIDEVDNEVAYYVKQKKVRVYF